MQPVHEYFEGERQAGLLVAVLGLLALGFSLWLRAQPHTFRAMLFPLGVVGLLQLGIGVGLALKTPPQVTAVVRGLTDTPTEARRVETARMARVQRNFRIVEVVEAVVVLAALAMVLGLRERPTLVAVGMGLLLQGAVMLAFDVFAEARGAVYYAWLREGA